MASASNPKTSVADFFSSLLRQVRPIFFGPPVHADTAPTDETEEGKLREMAFTFAVIALAAKLSRVDGTVKKEEFLTFCELFPLPHEERTKVHRLFILACRDQTAPEHYARRILELYPQRPDFVRDIVVRLCRLARADGEANASERQWLHGMAAILGVHRGIVEEALSEAAPAQADPYELLGVVPRASGEEIKQAYRRRIRELHPDALRARGYGDEDIAAADSLLATINAAYGTLARKRKIK